MEKWHCWKRQRGICSARTLLGTHCFPRFLTSPATSRSPEAGAWLERWGRRNGRTGPKHHGADAPGEPWTSERGEVVGEHSSFLAPWVRTTLDCSMQSLRGGIPWKPLQVHKLTPLYWTFCFTFSTSLQGLPGSPVQLNPLKLASGTISRETQTKRCQISNITHSTYNKQIPLAQSLPCCTSRSRATHLLPSKILAPEDLKNQCSPNHLMFTSEMPLILVVIAFGFGCRINQSVQFSAVTQSWPTLCDPMNCSTPGIPVHHLSIIKSVMPSKHLILCHSLLLPPSIFSQHQGLFQWVSSSHQMAKVLEFQLQHQSFQWTFRADFL